MINDIKLVLQNLPGFGRHVCQCLPKKYYTYTLSAAQTGRAIPPARPPRTRSGGRRPGRERPDRACAVLAGRLRHCQIELLNGLLSQYNTFPFIEFFR